MPWMIYNTMQQSWFGNTMSHCHPPPGFGEWMKEQKRKWKILHEGRNL